MTHATLKSSQIKVLPVITFIITVTNSFSHQTTYIESESRPAIWDFGAVKTPKDHGYNQTYLPSSLLIFKSEISLREIGACWIWGSLAQSTSLTPYRDLKHKCNIKCLPSLYGLLDSVKIPEGNTITHCFSSVRHCAPCNAVIINDEWIHIIVFFFLNEYLF